MRQAMTSGAITSWKRNRMAPTITTPNTMTTILTVVLQGGERWVSPLLLTGSPFGRLGSPFTEFTSS